MKKFSFSVSMFFLAATVGFLFVACQKEQSPAAGTDTAAASESNIVAGTSGTSSISGMISNSSAEALRATYIKVAGASETQYIQFSIDDVVTYLKAMKDKYGSDAVYVNFGVYDANTAPEKSYIGRKTVFFSVNNKKKSGGNIAVNGDGDSENPNSLNHGQIFP